MKTETRYAYVTETVTYHIEFEAPEGADDDTLEDLARAEWLCNPGRNPMDYMTDFEIPGGL